MSPIDLSPADVAYTKLQELVSQKAFFDRQAGRLSEADTRAKLIDPLFRDVLGWSETEIRREKSTSSGWADYVLGSDYAYLLVEAKRTKPRFTINAPSQARRLRLSGPHLMGNRKMASLLKQARDYASDLGVQSSILTNGDQFVVFRPFLPGQPWTNGFALVWHNYGDVLADFAHFFALLARDNVHAGSLIEGFEKADSITTELYSPLEFVDDNPNRELLRNRVWAKISRVMAPLLSDNPDDEQTQEEILKNCYVTTPLTDEADKNLDRLLRDTLSSSLLDAGVVDIGHVETKKGRLGFQLDTDIKMTRPGTYILTGGVGSGKTTFLKRFARVSGRDLVNIYCVWCHIDFLPIGNMGPEDLDSGIQSFTFRTIRELLENDYPKYIPQDGEQIRNLFSEELRGLELTRLHGFDPESKEWNREVNTKVEELFQNDERLVKAILRQLRDRGLRAVLVLDNTDQLGERFQERVFLFSQRLSRDFGAFCVVALREDKFFAAYRRGIFDAYGDRRFHIGSPHLREVLRKRLEYGLDKLEKSEDVSYDAGGLEREKTVAFLRSLIHSVTTHNTNIVRMLACVSNGDMRHSLDMFRQFLSSGNTNVDKILDITEAGGQYLVPFHEFAKSAILGSRAYYGRNVSHILNLFAQSEALSSSHLTACRILARLSNAQTAASEHGEGFARTQLLLREFRESWGFAEDFTSWAGELLRRGLIESEPPKADSVLETEALKISASGAYYWKYLVRAFAYLDLVMVDTPLCDKDLARKLGGLARSSDMADRFERVRVFLNYLGESEARELEESGRRAGPYREPLVRGIIDQVEEEIRVIQKKTT